MKSVLKRNANWWRAGLEKEKRNCNFDRIIVRYFASGENAYAEFKRGKIDFYPVYSARLMAQETSTEDFSRNFILKRRVVNSAPVGFQGFAMNMRREPFNDLRVRKAMAHLVDRERMNRVLMHGEYFHITDEVAEEINRRRANGGRIIAVGTTGKSSRRA